ncbi:unnamed protein product [Rotaria magnacalcarata]|uniref:Uncharacterized protein n=1 Tax=Rotaria magnacalcarata TaxID=392030 RepID=A0A815M715_9BILA|nr:unnamed protein product [Rotaria magnacalcarata]
MTSSSTCTTPFIIIGDSHGKCFDSTIITSRYTVKTYSISGLQWLSKYDSALSLFSLIQTDTFVSLLSSTSNILFLVGTNSVRSLPAVEVIQQIDQFFLFLYSHYYHLLQGNIILTTCLPCLKISSRYSTIPLLHQNIDHYNHLLFSLSFKHRFSILDLRLSSDWLGNDGLHINFTFRSHFANIILHYIDNLNLNPNVSTNVSKRSRESISRRNKIRNLKLKEIAKQFNLSREISSAWSYKNVKDFLKHNNIRFGRLSILLNPQLHLHFNNASDMLYADRILKINVFDSDNFIHWIHHNG